VLPGCSGHAAKVWITICGGTKACSNIKADEVFVMYKKVFTEVIVRYTMDGEKIPMYILWEDGRKFRVDRVVDSRPAPSLKVGGCGTRYTCVIGGREAFLWYEEGKWYVEAMA